MEIVSRILILDGLTVPIIFLIPSKAILTDGTLATLHHGKLSPETLTGMEKVIMLELAELTPIYL